MPNQIDPNLTSWASLLDDNALEQALRTSRLPILAGPVCLMADAHFGLGATVGSVMATKNGPPGIDVGDFRDPLLVGVHAEVHVRSVRA